MKLQQVILRGLRSAQPTADGTNIGSLYYVTDEDKLERSSGSAWEKYASEGGGSGVPSGVVVMWSGAIVDIPDGWFLCDGDNDTPDLRNLFIVGAGDTYAVADTGGTVDHSHANGGNTTPNEDEVFVDLGAENTAVAGATHSHGIAGDTETSGNLPPYFALAYIMKE